MRKIAYVIVGGAALAASFNLGRHYERQQSILDQPRCEISERVSVLESEMLKQQIKYESQILDLKEALLEDRFPNIYDSESLDNRVSSDILGLSRNSFEKAGEFGNKIDNVPLIGKVSNYLGNIKSAILERIGVRDSTPVYEKD